MFIENEAMESFAFLGELSLDGTVKGIKGVLPMCLSLKQNGFKRLVLAKDNADEAALANDMEIYPVEGITDMAEFLNEKKDIAPRKVDLKAILTNNAAEGYDFADVRGQNTAKRALEIAAAGAHNVIMLGPPGSGKKCLQEGFLRYCQICLLRKALK